MAFFGRMPPVSRFGIPKAHSLLVKLAVFLLVLALPVLLVVEAVLVNLEFGRFTRSVDRGDLAHAIEGEAREFERAENEDARALGRSLEALLLRLAQGNGSSGDENGTQVLMELSRHPLSAALIDTSGRLLAFAPSHAPVLRSDELPNVATLGRIGFDALLIDSANRPDYLRRYAIRIPATNGNPEVILMVALKVPQPWRKIVGELSFEWPLLVGFLLLFAIVTAAFLSRYVTQRLNRIAAAADAWSRGDLSATIAESSNDELGHLATQLNRMADELRARVDDHARLATLEERQRLARDLHDTVKQKAFALALQLAAAQRSPELSPMVAAKLVEARSLTEEIQQELAQMLDGLRSDTSESLDQLLRIRISDWSRRAGIATAMRIDTLPPIGEAERDIIIRIVDESLANVLKHSGASHVDVDFTRQFGRFTLKIADNGRGGAEAAIPGMGLANLRTRASLLPGGRFALESEPGRGTRVIVDWPQEHGIESQT